VILENFLYFSECQIPQLLLGIIATLYTCDKEEKNLIFVPGLKQHLHYPMNIDEVIIYWK
jgi:hypothetical protein